MEAERTKLIETLRDQGIKNQEVLDCISKIPRHFYVNESYRHQAYWNRPLPINEGQTISQPYIVALMSEKLLSNFKKATRKFWKLALVLDIKQQCCHACMKQFIPLREYTPL